MCCGGGGEGSGAEWRGGERSEARWDVVVMVAVLNDEYSCMCCLSKTAVVVDVCMFLPCLYF